MEKILRKLIDILKIIFLAKKNYVFPKKKKIIILDRVGSNKIDKALLNNIDYGVLDLRCESINLAILFLSIINIFKYGRDFYKITYIKYVNAKVAITFIDTSLHICRFMNKVKDCKLIFVQNGKRYGNEIFPFLSNKIKYKLSADYYFVFNEPYANFAKKHIKANFIVGGSILNNMTIINNNNNLPIKKIQYISEFHAKETSPKNEDYDEWELKPTQLSLNVIDNFCKKNNLKLEILGRTKNHQMEIDYYKKFKVSFDFIKKENDFYNYSVLSYQAIIIGMSSTLLFEAFVRKFRTGFFSFRHYFFSQNSFLKKSSPSFAFPEKTDDLGKFWSNVPDKENMKRNLNYLMKVSNSEWMDTVSKWSNLLMKYNHGNEIYKKILKQEGVL